jgi:ribosomal protein L5
MENVKKSSSTIESIPKNTSQKAISSLLSEKILLLEELASLQGSVDEARQSIAEITITKEQIVIAKQELEKIQQVALSDEYQKLRHDIAAAQRLESNLTKSLYEKEARYHILVHETEQKEAYSQFLSATVDHLRKEKESYDDISQQKEVQEAQYQHVLQEIQEQKIVLHTIMNDVEDELEKRLELQQEVDRLNTYISDTKVSIEEREGALNIKEIKLNTFEKRLEILKKELETYYNRKFPYIHL